MKRSVKALMVLMLAVGLSFPLYAQDEPEPAPATQESTPQPDQGNQQPSGRQQPGEPRPYQQVITRDAASEPGVFTVHRVRDRVYYEIPKTELGKDFLFVTQIARTTLGAGYGGQAIGNRVVRWERMNNRILLRNIDYGMVADEGKPIARAVEAANNSTIIMSFNIETFGPDEAVVIDVTRLFTTDVPEFSARTRLRARGMDGGRSFIERVAAFPENIEVAATHTYTAPTDPAGGGQAPASLRSGSATVVVHYSMVKLPEERMMPRLFDERVGYFSVRQLDYGRDDEHRAPVRRYITRWRLEKKDPDAAISEAVNPIVYWVDPATPTRWVPYIKRGIESWQSAFEAAGFKNAIIAREAPSPEEDPQWSPEDARYSVIRWLPSTTENASGPHIHDPRTGEILDADIQFHHNIMKLLRDWYFVQVAPLDPRAHTLPLPDELMGELLAYVTAHEVGHTLGLQHNWKASSTYPAEKVRDREWVEIMGHVPTVMDYARFNYVAQPEDNIDVQNLIPRIGPYDNWVIAWGYKQIPGAQAADDEKPVLDEWARQQDYTPWLRFSVPGSRGADPGEVTEAVGNADAVMASTLGMKNLHRVGDMLLSATDQPGEPYTELQDLYGRLLGQWVLEMNHVVALVGGFEAQQKHAGQEGVRFTPVDRERQKNAVKFLQENAFQVPAFATRPEILRRIEPDGVLSRVRNSQQRVLAALLNPARFNRLVEQEAVDGETAYTPTEFLEDLRDGIWSELRADQVQVDAYRRNTQRLYLDAMADRLNGRTPAADDARAFIRGELRELDSAIGAAMLRVNDRATRLHLEDARNEIEKALDPRFPRPAQTASVAAFGLQAFEDEAILCFPDYVIGRED